MRLGAARYGGSAGGYGQTAGIVEALLDAITEHRLIQVEQAIAMDFDGVFFGDDYGMQTGLMMGAAHWRHFIKPRLARLISPIARRRQICLFA